MKVYINTKEIVIFDGARIQDAILAYSTVEWKKVINGEISIVDRFGNQTDPDGPIRDGQQFTLKNNTEL